MPFPRCLRLYLPLVLGLLALTPLSAQVREADWYDAGPEVTNSASEQFRIFGGDARTRGLFASFAERQKSTLLQFLGRQDSWNHLIVIRIAGDLADPPVDRPVDWSINQFGEIFALEMRVTLGANFSREALRDTLLHMLMFEMALRDVEIPVTGQLIPRWLREGVPGALRLRREGRSSEFFKAMFQLNLVTPAKEILTATKDDIDPVSRAVYEASATGFVMMLLEQQGGPSKIGKLIHAHGGAHEARGHDLLARYFPALRGTEERLERTWVLYCAKLAAPQALEFLDPAATEAELAQALTVTFLEFDEGDEGENEATAKIGGFLRALWGRPEDRKGKEEEGEGEEQAASGREERPTREFKGSISDFDRFLARKDRNEILAPVRRHLLQLSFRSFPLYRPLVNDYLQIVSGFLQGKKKGVKARLEALTTERQRLSTLLSDVEDYMDTYEQTELDQKSGVFNAYLERARAVEQQSEKARDPISKYMQEVQRALE